MHMDIPSLFLVLLPIIAFLYAAVGHGGASGYLALMALFAFPPEVMKPTALLLNLFVAGIAFLHYWKEKHFQLKLFLVFALTSIPFSYLGGMMEIDPKSYKIILGITLIFAVARMLGVYGKPKNEMKEVNWPMGLLIGASIGFVSGLIGIGGGIILSPIIILLGWGTLKQSAAVSALFIWVNSVAGLAGMYTTGLVVDKSIYVLIALAVVGGFLGGFVGSKKMSNQSLTYLLAFVLVIAIFKLFFA